MKLRSAFALPELIVVMVILIVAAILVMMVLPRLGTRSHRAPEMQSNTQLRGIHQSMVMYAQGNKSKFPGLNPDGTDAGLAIEARLQILLEHNYFTGEYAISPAETKTAWTTGPVTSAHYSYAMLQIPAAGGRRTEWSETLNTEAPVLGDRNLGTGADPYSVWSDPGDGWRGTVAYNDNHVVFEQTHELPTGFTVVNRTTDRPTHATTPFTDDHLFESAGDDDALFIHSGNMP